MVGGSEPVPRHLAAGTDLMLSRVGISLDPPWSPRSLDVRAEVELLRRARARGVTTFDLSAARVPERAVRSFRAAFPVTDPELVVFLPRPAAPSGPTADDRPPLAGRTRTRVRGWPGTEKGLLAEVARTVEIDPAGDDAEVAATRPPPVGGATGGPAEPSEADRDAVPLAVGPFSLLDQRAADRWEGGRDRTFVAQDPFAGGRLDGSGFAAGLAGRPSPGPPASIRSLEEEFAPVLRLGFLTDHRRRTLPEAALQFVLSFPWVATVLLPPPEPDRLERWLTAASLPPLPAEDLARARAVGSSDTAPAPAARPGP